MNGDDLLTVQEVAAKLRCSPRFVLDELRRKNLRGSKLHEWRVDATDLKAYIDAKANVRPVRKAS